VRMILTVDNPDAVFDKAVAAGASVVSPVADQRYGWRVGRIVDPGTIGRSRNHYPIA
jgi:PhnB protein